MQQQVLGYRYLTMRLILTQWALLGQELKLLRHLVQLDPLGRNEKIAPKMWIKVRKQRQRHKKHHVLT